MRYTAWRRKMVEEQVAERGITDLRVLAAMHDVPRHAFLDSALADRAYGDHSLPIGEGQTMTQPYVVAYLLAQLRLTGREKVLEIGMGSGYLSALLSRLAERVFAIEKYRSLAIPARQRLERQNCHNVVVRIFDGTYGWSDEAPFDAIVVSAVAARLPVPLVEQLAVDGVMVIPLETTTGQFLFRVTRDGDGGICRERLIPCSFVPLVGRHAGA
ncbi:MAG: protein-L-isoaspartate(D-aspartate) O-methyltransferase [Deltaproteobacteria bacterium]|nr:protein-L-isoaspartate(D-aspartate) O-methyltransferase [Candidatus Anaeroferrophillacea bacterium]